MDPKFLELICCPESHQRLTLADPEKVSALNAEIGRGSLKNKAGLPVKDVIDEGLIREDGRILYPVRRDIPVLLIDEGIVLEGGR